jgi:exopolysaccharide production protein ExoY
VANVAVSKPAKLIQDDDPIIDPLKTFLLYDGLGGDVALDLTADGPGNGRSVRARSHLFSIAGPIGDQSALAQPPARRPVGGSSKRLLDVIIAGTALVLLSPLFLIVSLLIYVTVGRPIIFSHRRLGFTGRPFQCFKFRTMVNDAEKALTLHLAENPQAAREWDDTHKLQHDPRITGLGRALRRSSLDELPQLFSVLLGHMSCVGPRPVVDAEMANYGPYWAEYTRARPGVTGAWQVSGRNRLTYSQRVAIDRHYVRTWSLWRDLQILVRTIPAVLRTGETA